MEPIYRIIETDDWHAYPTGQVYRHEDGTYSARWSSGHLTAGGLPINNNEEADAIGDLVVRIRQTTPNALLCNVA